MNRYWLLGIIAVDLLLRVSILPKTFDFPGDGPARALMSYVWSHHPQWISSAYWVPGFIYLNGIFMWFFPQPIYTIRILNTLWSVPTLIAFYQITQRIFTATPALLSAGLLALLPLYVGLSTSSLSEPASICLFLWSLNLLMKSAEGDNLVLQQKRFLLGASVVFMVLAETIRVETWLYIPLMLCYCRFAWKTATCWPENGRLEDLMRPTITGRFQAKQLLLLAHQRQSQHISSRYRYGDISLLLDH